MLDEVVVQREDCRVGLGAVGLGAVFRGRPSFLLAIGLGGSEEPAGSPSLLRFAILEH